MAGDVARDPANVTGQTTSYQGLALPPRARLTPQRRALLAAVAESQRRFTAIELFQRARRASPRLGLATTYRTIELLRRTGSLRALPGDPPAYVRCNPGHHHHLVCVSCGSVEDTELCSAPAPREIKRRHGFRAEAHELEIYGTCRRCQ